MNNPNPEYIKAIKTKVKNSPYPSHMSMEIDEIEFDAAQGTCLRSGRSISYAEAKVFDEDKNLVAHGTSTLSANKYKLIIIDRS